MIFERLRRRAPEGGLDGLQAEIDELTAQNRDRRDPELERRILKARHLMGIGLVESGASTAARLGYASQGANGGGAPAPPEGQLPAAGQSGLPELTPAELTPELVKAAIMRDGCALVRGLVPRAEAQRLTAEIDRVFDARAEHGVTGTDPDGYYAAFTAEPPYGIMERSFVADAGDAFAGDSPRG